MKAAIVFGSRSDLGIMKKAAVVFREFGVEYTAHIVSAHRSPELLDETVKKIESGGAEVIVAGAGLAAHLPGLIAAKTLIPVIGVPVCSGGLGGMDALLSIAQMPKPVPVAAVGVDNGANAAYLACRILALKYGELKTRLAAFMDKMKAGLVRDAAGIDLESGPEA
ncbi:MAG: 5-(carboxyamino)imidazole ribonucleotide mutase [Treponema sp.]|jgi:5-(carboxyamino)imidazole ribonucleotide mutase|nr:5-(carboxyamino)imidazole ribonucleotide mutase [Treponema sp.]